MLWYPEYVKNIFYTKSRENWAKDINKYFRLEETLGS